jgi:hypothetical protein
MVPAQVPFRPWTLVTYMFLHAGFGHIFMNMLGLFFFGPRLEERLGGPDFLKLYFLAGMGGALLSFGAPFTPVVGASGGVFGVLMGFAMYWPKENIYIWGVLPVESRFLIGFLAIMSLYSGLTGANASVAHFAHLGGFAAGYLYLKRREKKRRVRVVERPNSEYKSPGVIDVEAQHRWEHMDMESLHEINRAEVSKILEKMQEVGVRGITPEERTFLDRMAQSLKRTSRR